MRSQTYVLRASEGNWEIGPHYKGAIHQHPSCHTHTCVCVCVCVIRLVMSDSCDPMDCSPPVSSVHGISRQEYWSGLPFPSPGDLPTQGSNLGLLHSQVDSLLLSHQGRPRKARTTPKLCLTHVLFKGPNWKGMGLLKEKPTIPKKETLFYNIPQNSGLFYSVFN